MRGGPTGRSELCLPQLLYHVRREGSAAKRHLLLKPWAAGIIPAKRGGPTCRSELRLPQLLYHRPEKMTEKVLFTKKGPGALAPDPSLMFFLCFMPFRERSSLNRDGLFRLNFFCVLLRDAQFQDTILKFRLDVFLCHSVAYIEASLHCAGITLLADVFAFLILLIFIQAFRSGNGQVTVLKFDVDLIFLESRQINVKFISCIMLTDICLHDILCILTIQRILFSPEIPV